MGERIAQQVLTSPIPAGAGIMRNSEINTLFQIAHNLRIPGGTHEVQRSTIAETLGCGCSHSGLQHWKFRIEPEQDFSRDF